LALTSEALVFAEQEGSVWSVPLGGGAAPSLLASTNGPISRPVTDGRNVYFCDRDGTKSVPLVGGTAPSVVTGDTCFSLAVGNDSLVLADFSGGSVLQLALPSGSTSTLATQQDGPLYPVITQSGVYWLNSGSLTKPGALEAFESGEVHATRRAITSIIRTASHSTARISTSRTMPWGSSVSRRTAATPPS
jgi:hypothetical protein